MVRSRRVYLTFVIGLVLIGAGFVILDRYCPASGLGFTASRRAVHRLKNRSTLPASENYDNRVTLQALLQPGNDEARWSEASGAAVEGYVVSVGHARTELANCYSPCRRDIHIKLALRTDAPPKQQFVV